MYGDRTKGFGPEGTFDNGSLKFQTDETLIAVP